MPFGWHIFLFLFFEKMGYGCFVWSLVFLVFLVYIPTDPFLLPPFFSGVFFFLPFLCVFVFCIHALRNRGNTLFIFIMMFFYLLVYNFVRFVAFSCLRLVVLHG